MGIFAVAVSVIDCCEANHPTTWWPKTIMYSMIMWDD